MIHGTNGIRRFRRVGGGSPMVRSSVFVSCVNPDSLEDETMKDESLSRRQFVQTTAGATAGLMLSSRLEAMSSSAPEVIKIGVIGCGGRGTGAARDCMRGAEGVQIYAM